MVRGNATGYPARKYVVSLNIYSSSRIAVSIHQPTIKKNGYGRQECSRCPTAHIQVNFLIELVQPTALTEFRYSQIRSGVFREPQSSALRQDRSTLGHALPPATTVATIPTLNACYPHSPTRESDVNVSTRGLLNDTVLV